MNYIFDGVKIIVFKDGTIKKSEEFKRIFPNAEVVFENGVLKIKNAYIPRYFYDGNEKQFTVIAKLIAKNAYTKTPSKDVMPRSWILDEYSVFRYDDLLQYYYDDGVIFNDNVSINENEVYLAIVGTPFAYSSDGNVKNLYSSSNYPPKYSYSIKKLVGSTYFNILQHNVFGDNIRYFTAVKKFADFESAFSWIKEQESLNRYITTPLPANLPKFEDAFAALSDNDRSALTRIEIATAAQALELIKQINNSDGSITLAPLECLDGVDKPIRIINAGRNSEFMYIAFDILRLYSSAYIDFGDFIVKKDEENNIVVTGEINSSDKALALIESMFKKFALYPEVAKFLVRLNGYEWITLDIKQGYLYSRVGIEELIDKYFYGNSILNTTDEQGNEIVYIYEERHNEDGSITFEILGKQNPIKLREVVTSDILKYCYAYDTLAKVNINYGDIKLLLRLPSISEFIANWQYKGVISLSGGVVNCDFVDIYDDIETLRLILDRFDFNSNHFSVKNGILNIKTSDGLAFAPTILSIFSDKINRIYLGRMVYSNSFATDVLRLVNFSLPFDTEIRSFLLTAFPTIENVILDDGSVIDVRGGSYLKVVLDYGENIAAGYDDVGTIYYDDVQNVNYSQHSFIRELFAIDIFSDIAKVIDDRVFPTPLRCEVKQKDYELLQRLINIPRNIYDIFMKQGDIYLDCEIRTPDANQIFRLSKIIFYAITGRVSSYENDWLIGKEVYISIEHNRYKEFLSPSIKYNGISDINIDTSEPNLEDKIFVVKIDKYFNIEILKNGYVNAVYEDTYENLTFKAVKKYDSVILESYSFSDNPNSVVIVGSSFDEIVLKASYNIGDKYYAINIADRNVKVYNEATSPQEIALQDKYSFTDENSYVEYSITKTEDGGIEVTYRAYDKDGNDITDQFKTLSIGDRFLHKEM